MSPIVRPVKRVENGPYQQGLFDSGPEEEQGKTRRVAAPEGVRSVFVDPSPGALFVGAQSLESFLQQTGLGEVFEVRKLIRELDFRAFYARYKPKGRVPYHPALMLSLILYSVASGRDSLRGIENFGKSDVRSWWLTGGAMPDHTVIGRFIQRHAESLSGPSFEQLTSKILQRTGSDPSDLAGDGTVICSVARRFGLLQEEAARDAATVLREKAENISGGLKDDLLHRAKHLDHVADVAGARTAAKTAYRGKKRGDKRAQPALVSPSDPDAVNQKTKLTGAYAPSYKPVVFANRDRIIVAQNVQTTDEKKAIAPLVEQAQRLNGGALDCLRLDAGFFHVDLIEDLLEHDVDNILIADRPAAAKKRVKGKRLPIFKKTRFHYDEQKDAYVCPQGHLLPFNRKGSIQNGRRLRIYAGAPCAGCPLREKCTKSKTGREIQRFEGEEIVEGARAVLEHRVHAESYKQRAAMVEPVFADLRQRQRFSRFLRRGLKAVSLEFAIHAAAHNLNRFLDLTVRGGRRFLATYVLRCVAALSGPGATQRSNRLIQLASFRRRPELCVA